MKIEINQFDLYALINILKHYKSKNKCQELLINRLILEFDKQLNNDPEW